MDQNLTTQQMDLSRLPRTKLPPFVAAIFPLLAVLSALLLGLAAPALIGAETFTDYLKCALLALIGGTVAYAVNRIAVERGAPQAAIGARTSLGLSVGAILMVGGGLFNATYAGLTLPATDKLVLEDAARHQGGVIAKNAAQARQASEAVAALRAVASDLETLAICERQESCVSGIGNGGRGPTFRALFQAASRAGSVLDEVETRLAGLDAALSRISELQQAFAAAISDETLSSSQRRLRAQEIHGALSLSIGALAETSPHALMSAFAGELRAMGTVPGNREVARVLSALFGGHADRLVWVISAEDQGVAPLPPLPGRAGVSDTLARIGHFLPLALLIGALELALPLTFWTFVYVALTARVIRNDAEGSDPESPIEASGDTPAADPPPAPRPARRSTTRSRRR